MVSEQLTENRIANSNSKYYNNYESYPITDDSIKNIKNIQIDGLTTEQCKIACEQRKCLLQAMQNEKVGVEGSISFNLDGSEVSPIRYGSYGETKIYISTKPFYAIHNHPDNGVLSPGDILNFLNKPKLIGFESIGNNGDVISAIVKTRKSENLLYEKYINSQLELFKRKFPKYSKVNIQELNDFSISLLKECKKYGFKITNNIF
ncbi:MAG: hypothetical protein NC397_09660 [Clostridium sp.]|nr:hypothetical protein [Clostridium sp.]